jgi:hypothetical protein
MDDLCHMITMELFTKGFYLLGFDLTHDTEADEDRVTCYMHSVCRNFRTIEIDGTRNVTLE